MILGRSVISPLIASILFFTACGDSSKKRHIAKDLMIERCSKGEFTSLSKGDKVTILLDNTELDIRHYQDGTKKACVRSGSAKVN